MVTMNLASAIIALLLVHATARRAGPVALRAQVRTINVLGKDFVFMDDVEDNDMSVILRELGQDCYNFSGLLKSGFSEKGVLLDIGGNIGITAVVETVLFPSLTVHTFEPFEKNFMWMKWNAALNEVGGKLKMHNFGLGKANETRSAYIDPHTRGGASTVKRTHALHEINPIWNHNYVHIAALDEFVRLNLKGARIAMVKLDCEGCEFEVGPWLMDLWKRDPFVLVGEVHFGRGELTAQNRDILKWMCNKGWKMENCRNVKWERFR